MAEQSEDINEVREIAPEQKKRAAEIFEQYSFIAFALITLGFLALFWNDWFRSLWLYRNSMGVPEWDGGAMRSVVLTIGGIWAFWGLTIANFRLSVDRKRQEIDRERQEIDRKRQFTDTSSRCLTLLSDERQELRIAGINLFKKLHYDDNDLSQRDFICVTISNFIRMNNIDHKGEFPELVPDKQRRDISTAILVLGMLVAEEDRKRRMYFVGFDLRKLNLVDAILRKAYLERSELSESILIDSDLSDAFMSFVRLKKSYLTGAKIINTDLEFSILSQADLSKTTIIDTNLKFSILSNSKLSHATLKNVNLTNALMYQIDITGADLTEVQPSMLTDGFLNSAIYEVSEPPKLPDGISVSDDGAYIIKKKEENYEYSEEYKVHAKGKKKGKEMKINIV